MSDRLEKLKIMARDHLLPGVLFRARAVIRGVPDANLRISPLIGVLDPRRLGADSWRRGRGASR